MVSLAFPKLSTLLAVAVLTTSIGQVRVQAQKPSWDTRLFRAASDGNIATLEELLSKGADVNAREIEGETPLMYAASRGRTAALLFLLKSGADIHAISENQYGAPD
jgi:ankyrin repeat protein